MQAVILAAGRGVRMGALTDNCPKPMLLIQEKPILAHKIEMLPKEIDEVILIVGYLKEKIQKYFKDKYAGRKISYCIQDNLNGTGGALHLAKDMLDGEFIVMMGDDLYHHSDVKKILGYQCAIAGYNVDDPKKYGIIVKDERGKAIDIIEKPSINGSAHANIALYKLNKRFFEYPLVSIGNGEYGLPQTMIQMKDAFPIALVDAKLWHPIGNPEDLKVAHEIIEKFRS